MTLDTHAVSVSQNETHSPLNGLVRDSPESYQPAMSTDVPMGIMSDNSVTQTDGNVPKHIQTWTNDSENVLEPLLTSNNSETDSSPQGQMLKLVRVVCNYNSSSANRRGRNKFLIQNMSAALCTDVYYDHAVISDQTYDIQAISQLDVFPMDGNMFIPSYVAINDFKVNLPKLRTFLTVTDSPNVSFIGVVDHPDRLKLFTKSCVHQARTWGFNGINIKWPNPPKLAYLVHLMQSLRAAFDEEKTLYKLPKLLLGVMLFGDISFLKDYEEVSNFNSYVDQVTLLAFNAAGYTLNRTRLVSPLYRPNVSFTNAEMVSLFEKEQEMLANVSSNVMANDNSTMDSFDNNSRTNQSLNSQNDHSHNISVNALSTDDVHMLDQLDVVQVKSHTVSLGSSSTIMTDHSSRIDGIEMHDPDLVLKRSRRNEATQPDVNLHDSITALIKHGVDKSKINVGITLTGHSYKLRHPRFHGVYSPALGPGQEFHKTGQVYFFEMCDVKDDHVTTLSPEDETPYWYINQTWVSYESMDSIRQKVQYIMSNHLGGVMLLSQSEDDFTGLNCNAGTFPVSRMVYNMSNVGRGFGHYSYSFPWVDYCSRAYMVDTNVMVHSLVLLHLTLCSIV
ncbi:hypothetical protein Btru_065356 [Bulinus truncatus]|nr:hypothetical protein Btru_065356 [Bulinus truncatus]